MTHPALINIATLNIAIKAARRASRIINRAARNLDLLDVASKQPNDFVTQIDREAENAIVEVLREASPDYGILAEESGLSIGRNPQSECQWVVDPLDGTTNFIHGFPQYAISIALMKNEQIEQGVIYDVNRNELFVAARGKGAFLNDRRLRVSGRLKLQDALIGTGFPYRDFQHLNRYLRIFWELTQKTAGLRRPGAASLDLAYVAAGRLDGFWEFGLAPWDMAAGSLMVTEAGGYVCDPFSNADCLHSGDIVAASPRILAQLQAVIQNADKTPRAA
ncbi:MAG: inositol monophosphatase [Zoogloeaceae bacterium]|jgi:myo-inositol-1(or 4)-monophosphatase|nr:inositol monophosphatase [Zoogloeaceae bacterium]